ncbi:MAG: hypothetical protein ACFFAU_00300 [Candidatus Hodarchaeota archaeon]
MNTQLATRLLEDKSTLLSLQIQNRDIDELLTSPLAILVSIFGVQPSKDFTDASNNLFRTSSQPGVQIIRQIFPAPLTNPKKHQIGQSYTGLMLLVRVSLKFRIRSEKTLPSVLREARREFLKRRSMTYTLLEASGCNITLITGKRLLNAHLHGEKISEGISVFRGLKGFHSKLIQPFLKLDRVPSRIIYDYPVQNLPVVHKIGTRIDDSSQPVGLPKISRGTVLTCGYNNLDIISVLQKLTVSFAKTRANRQIFVIDSRNEMNGVIKYLQHNPTQLGDLNLQIFRLGTNIHLNLCDVTIPLPPSGQKNDLKARAAWKSHIISQILLSSLNTSDYLSQRFSIPLEAQIKKTAEEIYNFTLKEVKLNIGGANITDVQVEKAETDMMFADMMAIDSLAGILDHFRSFPEVNYSGFAGHYSNTLTRDKTLTFFQFGAQPPLIRRATVAFLLHFLSEIEEGCMILTHSEEFLSRKTAYGRSKAVIPSSLVDACNKISQNNVLILGTQSLQALSQNMDSFEEIKNNIYLKMVSLQDREIVRSIHELLPDNYSKQPFLGISDGEGLLFREDAPQNVGFHFKIDPPNISIDFQPIELKEMKQRGSQTLGLTPDKYDLLMKILKLLINRPAGKDEAIALIEVNKHGEISLDQFLPLGLWDTQSDKGATYWTINQKGRDYYNEQYKFLASLPTPLSRKEVEVSLDEFKRLESLYDISSSLTDRLETNNKVKTLIGRLLNYLRHLKLTSIPWARVAEYYDLLMIESLEWQDFNNLFELANAMCNNLNLEITNEHNKRTDEEIQRTLQASSIKPTSIKTVLDDFLPDNNYFHLQKMSCDLEMDVYPNTGILDLFFELNLNNRSLFDELEKDRRKEES